MVYRHVRLQPAQLEQSNQERFMPPRQKVPEAITPHSVAHSCRRNCRAVQRTAVVTLFAAPHTREEHSALPKAKSPHLILLMCQPPTAFVGDCTLLVSRSADHSFCSLIRPHQRKNYPRNSPSVPAAFSSPQLSFGNSKYPRTNKELIAPPSEREKKQKKRVNIKTANGS